MQHFAPCFLLKKGEKTIDKAVMFLYLLCVFIQNRPITEKGNPMTIAHSARKIIKTQRFIFRALPVLLASMFILTACIGTINIPNLSISNGESFCEANPFRHSCSQAEFETARERIVADCQAGQKDSLCSEAGAYYCYLNPDAGSCARGQQNICDENPFRYSCSSPEFESARTRVIDDCIAGRTTGSLCEEAGGYFCHLNQDDPDCTGGVSQVIVAQTLVNDEPVSYEDGVRDCIDTNNILYTECTDVYATYTCLHDPFTNECASDTEFAPFLIDAQNEREDFCRYFNYYGNDELCTSAIAHICGNNPDPSDELCRDDDPTIVNSNDWVRSSSPYDFEHPVTTRIITNNPRNQFLQIKNGLLDTGGAISTDYDPQEGVVPNPITLNLNTATFGGAKIGGDANDGVSFFLGWVVDDTSPQSDSSNDLIFTKHAYAAVLDTTELGRPNQHIGKAEWYGSFMDTTNLESTDFLLEIVFGGRGEQAGTLKAFIWQSEENYHLLEGNFDTSGVITGNVTSGLFLNSNRDYRSDKDQNSDGILRGVIGERGAVGAFFHAGIEEANGFVAHPRQSEILQSPNVVYSDWVRGFTTLNRHAIMNNAFLTKNGQGPSIRETYYTVTSADDNAGEPTPVSLNLGNASFNNKELFGGGENSVGFFHGLSRTTADDGTDIIGTTRYYYAWVGIYTDLGATLPVWQTGQPASAEWNGQFIALHGASGRTDRDFTLEINFENSAVEAFVPRTDTSVPDHHYYIQGQYDEHGVIKGTVERGFFTNNNRARAIGSNRTWGVVNGLIGQNGAVGAFISGDESVDGRNTITGGTGNNGYSGGFVACPLHADGRCMSASR